MKINLPLGALFAMLLISCGTGEPSKNSEDTADYSPVEGDIVINEVSPKADFENEFGEDADWIELYNTTSKDIILKTGEWSVTDESDEPQKYVIPEVTIPSKGYLIIWCDGQRVQKEQIHASFRLSAAGELIALYHDKVLMDEFVYDSVGTEYRYFARKPDGSDNWKAFEEATPGSPNR